MKKCIIISDSFKGSLSSRTINELFTKGCKEVFPQCEVLPFLVADGGEGSLEVISHYLDGEFIKVATYDANMNEITSEYYLSQDVAYIEVAKIISLPMTKIKNPLITSSYGVGQVILDAINHHVKKIIIALGGSSTNDGGVGIACALGGKFYNKKKKEFIPTGGTLNQIESYDLSSLKSLIKGIEIIGMCDVDNVFYGEKGASLVFSYQKGASLEDAQFLDENMKHLATLIAQNDNVYLNDRLSSGAAGGIGGGIIAFLNGKLYKGISLILNLIKFESYLDGVDVIFTGEGKFDEQTLHGKVISGVKKIANKHHIPLVVIAGGASISSQQELKKGVEAIVTTTRLPLEFEKLIPYSEEFYLASVINTMRLINLGESLK